MRAELQERYIDIVNYLGLVLGPSYEVALHDLSMGDETIIAIANGHVTNRTLGSPLTSKMADFINNERYLENKYEVNYHSRTVDNKVLRSSTIYIKDGNSLVGLLCITFDDSRFKDISDKIMSLCHPDELLKDISFEKMENVGENNDVDYMSTNVDDLVNNHIEKIIGQNKLDKENLKKKDRVFIVKELVDKGVFLLKGSVTEVSKELNISEATIYRYLDQLEKN